MDIQQLSKIGLTHGEIKVYVALIKNGSQSKSPLAMKADVSSSKVYEIAGKLIKKGLVSSFQKNNVTYYSASDPIFLEKFIEEKEKELYEEKEIVKKIIPKLKSFKESSEERISFELQEGWKGIENAMMEGIENTPKNSIIYGIGTQFPRVDVVNRFHKERLKKKIKLKLILPESIDKNQNYKDTSIKFISEVVNIGMGIYSDRVLIQTIDTPPLNLVMKHPRIVQSFLKIYDVLWKLAKK